MNIKKLFILSLLAISVSSCTFRLVDFTVISSKNVSLDIDRSLGKKVEASKSYFLGIGWNIKDAMDLALEKAGPEYDLLIDGVVRYSEYPFVASVSVEGTAVSSKAMKSAMGEEEFNNWLNGKKLSYDKKNQVVKTE